MILQWWTHVITHLPKFIEGTTPRGNPNVNYRLWMMMMYQCRLTNCAKGTTLVENADSGRGCACVGGRRHMRTLSAQFFCYEPQTALRNKVNFFVK